MSFDPKTILWKYELTSKTILRRYLDPMGLSLMEPGKHEATWATALKDLNRFVV